MFSNLVFAAMFLGLTGCAPSNATQPSSDEGAGLSWWQWHNDKRAVDEAVAAAENDPRGADMQKAIDILRSSGRPQNVIDLQVGSTIVGAYRNDRPVRRYPKETLAQGLALLEKAAVGGGEGGEVAPQRLRIWFERGVGTPPKQAMRPDPQIAACWLAVEEKRSRDARSCIALRLRKDSA